MAMFWIQARRLKHRATDIQARLQLEPSQGSFSLSTMYPGAEHERNQIVGPEASGSKLPAAAPRRGMPIRCATSHYVFDIAQIAVQGPDI